jgi:transcriptional regulator with XRE-family HTH domain
MPALNPEIVKVQMMEQGVTRSMLCAGAGISASYLSRIINGKVPVTDVSLVRRLAAALSVEPALLTASTGTVPVRLAVAPHLWSAPLLNAAAGSTTASKTLFTILESDPSATGHNALTRMRQGTAEMALAFETPLNMTEAADILTLGSVCSGTDYVRLLIHRASPLLRRFEPLLCGEAALRPSPPSASAAGRRVPEPAALAPPPAAEWAATPTISLREETIVGDYLQQLEAQVEGFDSIRPVAADAARPWLSQGGDPIHAILTWEPIASAINAASDCSFVDLFAELAGRIPNRLLPRPTEYRILLSRHRPPAAERLREAIRGLADATQAMNHLSGKSRVILKSQPVIARLADSLPFRLPPAARELFCDLIAQRLAATRFHVRLWPEAVTGGLL